MGTSSSNTGPSGSSPLVPPWADLDGVGPGPSPEPQRFKEFRTELRRFTREGGEERLRSALGHYARKGVGGGTVGARRLGPYSRAGAQLAGILVSGGTTGAGRPALDLNTFIGRPTEEAIEGIVNALARGGTQDEHAIRRGLTEALAKCLARDATLESSALSEDNIVSILEAYITESIVIRVQLDGGVSFSSGDPVRDVAAERELRSFVRVVVDLVAGARLRDAFRAFDSTKFEILLSGVFQDVFERFGAYA